jgi:hypothetical protein
VSLDKQQQGKNFFVLLVAADEANYVNFLAAGFVLLVAAHELKLETSTEFNPLPNYKF